MICVRVCALPALESTKSSPQRKAVVSLLYLHMPSAAVESLHVRLSDLFQHRIRLRNDDHSAWATILFTSALCVASYWSSISDFFSNNSSSIYAKTITIILPLSPIVWFEVKLLFSLAISRRRNCRNYRLDYAPPVATSSWHIAWRSLSDALYLMVLLPSFLVRFSSAQITHIMWIFLHNSSYTSRTNTTDFWLASLCNQVDCLRTCNTIMGNDFG